MTRATLRQRAIGLSARICSAPAQGGKTLVQYFTHVLNDDMPRWRTRTSWRSGTWPVQARLRDDVAIERC